MGSGLGKDGEKRPECMCAKSSWGDQAGRFLGAQRRLFASLLRRRRVERVGCSCAVALEGGEVGGSGVEVRAQPETLNPEKQPLNPKP